MALDAIFAGDLRKTDALYLLEQTAKQNENRQNQEEIVSYARDIVTGISQKASEIDDRIASFSHQWSIDRMPAVDRAILRVSCWELLFNQDVPDPVVISEAVELAREYSTEESGAFINGLLGAIAATKSAR